ncbi:MAG: glycosyltransferase family 4 protein [Dehalococcoidia bacterium]
MGVIPMRVIFLPGFVSPQRDYKASDAVGYGITAAEALSEALSEGGVDVVAVKPRRRPSPDMERQRLAWILDGYKALVDLDLQSSDLIFIFHSFQHFPSEVRRILLDLRKRVPVVGYTHGSHWDPTDLFRFIHYPGMEVTDLANLLCLDRVLLPSHYLRGVLLETIAKWQPEAASQLEGRMAVVGLPINIRRLDAYRTQERFDRPTIVFNHSLIPSKAPEVFLEVAAGVLEKHDINVVVTRQVEDEALNRCFRELSARFPGRLIFGETYSLPEYFRILWKADFQISTALHEGLGIATLEAMYAYNCCLLPNRCSYPEITGGLDDALYSSTEELVHKIDYYLQNEAARRKVAAALHQQSLRYTAEPVASRLVAVFSELSHE